MDSARSAMDGRGPSLAWRTSSTANPQPSSATVSSSPSPLEARRVTVTCSAAVRDHVVQRLLGDADTGDRDLGRRAPRLVDPHVQRQPARPNDRLAELSQQVRQARLGERGRPQLELSTGDFAQRPARAAGAPRAGCSPRLGAPPSLEANLGHSSPMEKSVWLTASWSRARAAAAPCSRGARRSRPSICSSNAVASLPMASLRLTRPLRSSSPSAMAGWVGLPAPTSGRTMPWMERCPDDDGARKRRQQARPRRWSTGRAAWPGGPCPRPAPPWSATFSCGIDA